MVRLLTTIFAICLVAGAAVIPPTVAGELCAVPADDEVLVLPEGCSEELEADGCPTGTPDEEEDEDVGGSLLPSVGVVEGAHRTLRASLIARLSPQALCGGVMDSSHGNIEQGGGEDTAMHGGFPAVSMAVVALPVRCHAPPN